MIPAANVYLRLAFLLHKKLKELGASLRIRNEKGRLSCFIKE
jgi:hypothetical protein